MARQWACKCGHLNDPTDANFSTHKCGLCGKDKWLSYYIAGGGAVVLMTLATVIAFMLSYPESAYRSRFRELYRNDVLAAGGLELTAEEREQLNTLSRRFKLADKVQAWEKEEQIAAGHDAYRETFEKLWSNRDASPDGNKIAPAEREQLSELAKDYRISPPRIASFEESLVAILEEAKRPAPTELIALLYEVYSDNLKSDDEQNRLAAAAQKYRVTDSQLEQVERDIRQRWQTARPDFERALRLAEERNYAGSVAAFQNALKVDGDNPWILANLAAANLEVGRPDESQVACRKALRVDPNNWLAHYNLGSAYAQRGAKDEAIRELSTALSIVAGSHSQRITRTDLAARLKADKSFSALRNDPRFQELLAKN